MAAYAFFCNISIFCVGFKPISGISFKIRTLFAVSCVACILMHERTTRNVIHHLSGIHDFVCSVHLDARKIFPYERFYSCNKLHATGENDLTSVRDLRFRATSCTLRGGIMLLFCGFEVDDINSVCADKKFNDVFSVQ